MRCGTKTVRDFAEVLVKDNVASKALSKMQRRRSAKYSWRRMSACSQSI